MHFGEYEGNTDHVYKYVSLCFHHWLPDRKYFTLVCQEYKCTCLPKTLPLQLSNGMLQDTRCTKRLILVLKMKKLLLKSISTIVLVCLEREEDLWTNGSRQ